MGQVDEKMSSEEDVFEDVICSHCSAAGCASEDDRLVKNVISAATPPADGLNSNADKLPELSTTDVPDSQVSSELDVSLISPASSKLEAEETCKTNLMPETTAPLSKTDVAQADVPAEDDEHFFQVPQEAEDYNIFYGRASLIDFTPVQEESFQIVEAPKESENVPPNKPEMALQLQEQLLEVAVKVSQMKNLQVMGKVALTLSGASAAGLAATTCLTTPIGLAIGAGVVAVSAVTSVILARKKIVSGAKILRDLQPEQKKNLVRKLRRAVSQAGIKTATQLAEVISSPKKIINVVFKAVVHFLTDELNHEIASCQPIDEDGKSVFWVG